jgi:hypothetical protein
MYLSYNHFYLTFSSKLFSLIFSFLQILFTFYFLYSLFIHFQHFAETLHLINETYRFVLVSGGTDQTVPNGNGDTRYHKLRGMPQGSENYNRIINSDSVVHWFAENRDVYHPKLSTLPTGLVGDDVDDMQDFRGIKYVPIGDRPLSVLSADRLRPGTLRAFMCMCVSVCVLWCGVCVCVWCVCVSVLWCGVVCVCVCGVYCGVVMYGKYVVYCAVWSG